jgi:hypothetical protein
MAKSRTTGPRKPGPRKPRNAAAAAHRAVVIHSVAHASAALRAAREENLPIELWSAEGAAAYAGAGWFKAVIELAQSANPGANFTAVLDCADLAGLALGAFRIGLKAVCFTGPAMVRAKLADIARQEGRELRRRRPSKALDLRDEPDPPAACRSWLAKCG